MNSKTKAEYLYKYAISAFNSQNFPEAIKFLYEVLKIEANHATTYNILGLSFQNLGQYSESLNNFRKAIEINPQNPDYYINYGLTLQETGENDSAIECFKKAVKLEPKNPYFYNGLAVSFQSIGNFDDAIENLLIAISLQKDNPEFYYSLANLYLMRDDFESAGKNYLHCILINPSESKYYSALGKLCNKTEDYKNASNYFSKAVELEPSNFDYLSNFGPLLINSGQFKESLEIFRRAIELNPGYPDLYSNYALALEEIGDFEKARENYFKAIKIKPDKAQYYSNLAGCYEETCDYSESFKYYKKALELSPYDSEINYNISLLYLMHGDFENGWRKYGCFGSDKSRVSYFESLGKKEWDGSDLKDKTLYVFSEQGLGDTIQFIRFLPEISSRCGKIIFNCQPELKRLLESSKCFDIIISEPIEKIPYEYDSYISIMDLPSVLKINFELLKTEVPYVFAPDDQAKKFIISEKTKTFKIGICWRPNPTHKTFNKRSFPLEYLCELGKINGVSLINLQKGIGGQELENILKDINIFDFSEKINDFADTASLIENLDLIITVDTAVAHLAGAMGKRTWTLLPFSADWRWFINRNDSPWYPSMTLFRQESPGNWKSVFENIKSELEKLSVSLT